jgi:mono/diheme cytochrome c family protein
MILRALVFAFVTAAAASAADMTHFEQRIRPLLIANCIDCHGPDKQKGGLRLDSRAGWQSGGDSGPAIVPGKLEESRLWRAVTYVDRDLKMPPKRKLKDSEIADIKLWIESGAPDPRDAVASSADKHKQPRADATFWSFQPPRDYPQPSVQNKSWPANSIDRFILAKLEQNSLAPAPDADAGTLLRRLCFDLTGLPPSKELFSSQFSVLSSQIQKLSTEHSALSTQSPATPAALESLVDYLLSTDAFAERFASHWLDITRFAESSGGGRSLPFKDAWRFRDYVIESIRDDVPIDRMITEQLAGDLMPHENAAQRRRQLTATGFLALGPTNYEEQDKGMLRMDIVDEQLDTMGRAFLGLTIGCARCHDHKFDPISARDYYALAGILRSTKTLKNYTDNVAHWIDTPLPLDGEAETQMQAHEKQVATLKDQIAALKDDLRDAGSADLRKRTTIAVSDLPGIVVDDSVAQKVGMWKNSTHYGPYIGDGYVSDHNEGKGEKTITFTPKLPKAGRYEVRVAFNAGPGRAENATVTILHADGEELKGIKMATDSLKGLQFASLGTFRFEANGQGFVLISNAASQGYVTVDAVQFVPAEEATDDTVAKKDSSNAKKLKTQLSGLEKQLKELLKDRSERPEAMSVADDTAPEDAKIHIRGSTRNLGAAVPRGFIQAAMRPNAPAVPADASGRLQLAQWITSRDNPLGSRVMVNRVWHWIFGSGIVRTTDNFGSTGEAPSHPELLDHLAIQFMEDGWSLKRLVKEMVMSRTYRQSSFVVRASVRSDTPDGLKPELQTDPDNRLFSRMNRKRLDAECLRDAMLVAAGTLDRKFGGPGVSEVKAIDSNDQKIQNIEYGYQFLDTRRSLYTAAFRNVRHPLFEVFDFADINQPIAQRTTSTVATQALFLMNSPKVIEQARAAADVALKSSDDTAKRIHTAFQNSLQRAPTAKEQSQVREYLESSQSGNATAEETRDLWARFIQTLWATPEFRFLD